MPENAVNWVIGEERRGPQPEPPEARAREHLAFRASSPLPGEPEAGSSRRASQVAGQSRPVSTAQGSSPCQKNPSSSDAGSGGRAGAGPVKA